MIWSKDRSFRWHVRRNHTAEVLFLKSPHIVCRFIPKQATPSPASKTSKTPPFRGPIPRIPPRLAPCRDSLWERAIGSMPFRQSHPSPFRSNLNWHRVSGAGSRSRFPSATVQLMKPYPQPCTPTVSTPTLYTTEGVYGVCARGATQFADPPDRAALMREAFGSAVVGAGIFAAREMPHGATVLGGEVYFAVHAPHAVCATLILVDETAPGGPSRKEFPMTLTNDTFYWWCDLPALQAPPGTRYRFLLNDNVEVIDPAARAVQDGGSLKTSFGDDPADPSTSWSIVLDAAA